MTLSDRAVAQLRTMIDRPETTDGRYVVLEEIGRGGMGVVFRATDTTLSRDVALKVVRVVAIDSSSGSRLTREAQILARLEHPGIVPVHDTGQLQDGREYYVMRLVRGERLDTHMSRNVSRGELLRIMLRLCETVAFAHEHNVVHRDLKPGNVMVGPFGDVLVLDWGVAKLNADARVLIDAARTTETVPSALSTRTARGPVAPTADGAIVGTPGYMSPEQASGNSATVDARADVYSLGAILRELLGASVEPIPRALSAVIARATAPDPDDRYESAASLARDIQHWMDGESVSAYREGALERTLRFYTRHQVAILLAAAYLVVRFATVILRRG